jgi:hypothetical protein
MRLTQSGFTIPRQRHRLTRYSATGEATAHLSTGR